MILNDTIAAVATAVGEGGIGVIRISGDKAIYILKKIFEGKSSSKVEDMKSYTMRYGHIKDEKGEIIDEVIVSFMKAPNTYTREDVVEISCHGGIVPVRRILSVILENGARMAEPGEFTKRAFLNGRIDLAQAEAVMDLIKSKTDESLKVALEQSGGKLSKRVKALMDRLLKILANIEALIDFPEDEIDEEIVENIIGIAKDLTKEIDEIVKKSETGKILREGLNTIIAGKPNVGKSSIMNVLLESERAIVTDIPGTTRDVIEEYININGVPVKIVDTAGIRETEDIVEKIGVEKTKKYIDDADLVIFIADGSRHIDEEDKEIIEMIKEKNTIIVINKSDLDLKICEEDILKIMPDKKIIFASANNEEGIDEIKKSIVELVYKGEVSVKDVYVTNVRHKDVLLKAAQSINSGIEAIIGGFPLDMTSIDFRDAYLKLGEITGDTVADDIIDRIFTDFCIGK